MQFLWVAYIPIAFPCFRVATILICSSYLLVASGDLLPIWFGFSSGLGWWCHFPGVIAGGFYVPVLGLSSEVVNSPGHLPSLRLAGEFMPKLWISNHMVLDCAIWVGH